MKKTLFAFLLLAAAFYGANLLYYELTGGFRISNITSDFAYDPRWEIRPLSPEEKQHLRTLLNQEFTYLGKGCQAYVFASADGNYVLKFFKYQRYRTKPWVDFFSFIPFVEEHRQARIAHKKNKLERFFNGWEVAFDDLQKETGLVYVHLNKTTDLQQTVTILDKMGYKHQVDLDQMEFLVQRKAVMFTDEIDRLMHAGEEGQAKALITAFIDQLLSEYSRGLVDNDHAIMQNTGVIDGRPIHIDVGQFMRNPEIKYPALYKQDLFNKTYKFRMWLKERYPSLASFVEAHVEAIIGPDMWKMKPHFITD
jgi:hypothetical protein